MEVIKFGGCFMIFAASVVYFDEERADEAIRAIDATPGVERHDADMKKGKIVITIEAPDNTGVESAEESIRNCPAVLDVAHYAFHFGEEVDKVLAGEMTPDINIEEAFKKKKYK